MGIIGSIRKHSWIAVAVVGGAIIAFIIGDVWKNNSRIPDMGKINNSTITYQRFNELTEEMENNYKRQQGVSQVPADVEYQLRDQVWQTLVGETLTEEQLNKLGLTVTNAELSDMYLGNFIHPYLRQSFTDPKTGTYQTEAIQYYLDNFENLDTAQRMQWMELEKAVKADRKQQKYSNLIARGMYMPNNIAKQIAEMGNQLSNVTALNLTYQSVEDGEITLSDEDYQNYYKKHKAEFRVREELRELDYIVYPIVPTAQDMANIQAEVEKTWEEFQTIEPDELIFFVNYRKASEFTSPMDSALMAAGEGSLISPRIAGNEWIMGKVLKVANRPDSIRASLIQILNSKVGGNITRGDEQAKLLADSVLNVLRSGAMTFEEAVEKYSEDPQKSSNGGDMGWQLDGYYGLLNEDIVNNAEGSMFITRLPNEIGYTIVKVTGKTPLNRKYRVATITRTIAASETTTRNIYNSANKFAGNNRTYAEMTAAAQAENLQIRNGMVNSMTYSLAGINNARSIIENQVRIEKKAELLKARLEEAKQTSKDIASIAAKMNVKLDTLDSISFNDYFLGAYGMEPKVQAAIAASAENTLIGPIQGANGVYMVKVNSKTANTTAPDVAAIRSQKEQSFRQSLRNIQLVLRDNAKVIDQRNKFF